MERAFGKESIFKVSAFSTISAVILSADHFKKVVAKVTLNTSGLRCWLLNASVAFEVVSLELNQCG